MEARNHSADTRELLVGYLQRHGEASARRMAHDLRLEKTGLNSILYGNQTTFQSVGDRPPIWSLREVGPNIVTSQLRRRALESVPPSDADTDATTMHFIAPTSVSSTTREVQHGEPSSSRRHSGDGPLVDKRQVRLDEDTITEIELLATRFPGITVAEISALLEIDPQQVSKGITRVRHLILMEEPGRSELSSSDLALLESLKQAGTMAHPLSTDAYDDLVRRGFVKGRSSVRVTQVFGSWRRACELAGVEAPAPIRLHYERRWTERELADVVARFLVDSEYRGAHRRYDEWREKTMKIDEIPSSGTLKNYLGRRWRSVQNRGLQVLREGWLPMTEGDADE